MPTVINSNLNRTTVDILNAIRNSATANYRNYVPTADNNITSIHNIGSVIMDYAAIRNEFLSALINRIGLVLVKSRLYRNPWSAFKKGELAFGETVEEIFVNIAQPFSFDPQTAESNVFKRNIPDVRSAFHVMNYQKFYKHTVSREQLRQAFLTIEGVTDLIAKIVEAMYSGANYDEFLTMKYMLARHILAGHFYPVAIPTVIPENTKRIASIMKATSTDMSFMKTKYNIAGVENYADTENQYIIMTSDFVGDMDVEVLASAFNLSYADFLARRVMIDGFGELDTNRLNKLFTRQDGTYEEGYTPLTADELTALSSIPAVLVDKDFFMIFDNLTETTDNFNGEGLYFNYWLHVWKTFSVSPFSNACVFIGGTPSVTSVTVTPSTATLPAVVGAGIQLTADVVTVNFASKAVTWSTSNENVTVDNYGKVTITGSQIPASVTITATSVFDDSKTGTATITIEA